MKYLDVKARSQTSTAWLTVALVLVCLPIFEVRAEAVYRTGDVNASDSLDLTDAVVMLNFLFQGGTLSTCEAVADVNGSGGAINIADPQYLLAHLFMGGPAPNPELVDCDLGDFARGLLPSGDPRWTLAPTIQFPPAQLPAAFDWRDHGVVPQIRDQGACGSCWAFATVGILECKLAIQEGIQKDYSEQFLVDCNRSGWSCAGGWFAHSYHLCQDNPRHIWSKANGAGSVTEFECPYVGFDQPCQPYDWYEMITDWAYVQGKDQIPSVAQIKAAIFNEGPVACAVKAGYRAFFKYKGGIMSVHSAGPVDHAVILVGWNDNNGQGYWILRNSWGPTWGEGGYMRIRYGTSSVGHAANFVYDVMNRCCPCHYER